MWEYVGGVEAGVEVDGCKKKLGLFGFTGEWWKVGDTDSSMGCARNRDR